MVKHLQQGLEWIRRRAAAALRLGCASADGAAMAADDVGELERVLDDLKRQLPEGHALAAIIADEELDFEQVTELTLDDLREVRVGFVYRFDFAACLLLLRMGPSCL